MGEIVGCNKAREIWEFMRRVYESSSTTRIMGIRAQLERIKKDGLTVSWYLSQIKDITYKFAAIGEPLSYRDHLGYILEGLGVEYDPFVTSVQNRTNTPSLEDVRSLMLSYEARIESRNTVEQLNLIQANMANLNFSNNIKRQPNHSIFSPARGKGHQSTNFSF